MYIKLQAEWENGDRFGAIGTFQIIDLYYENDNYSSATKRKSIVSGKLAG